MTAAGGGLEPDELRVLRHPSSGEPSPPRAPGVQPGRVLGGQAAPLGAFPARRALHRPGEQAVSVGLATALCLPPVRERLCGTFVFSFSRSCRIWMTNLKSLAPKQNPYKEKDKSLASSIWMTNVKSHCSVRTRSSSLTRRYPGTEAAPLATVSAAVNELRVLGGAGNTVVLRPGRNALHVGVA